MPPAARITDMHTYPMVGPGPTTHVGGPMRRCLAILFCALALSAVEVPAVVVKVSDGDTITATLASGAEAKVRLLYIDTPESHNNRHGDAMPEGKLAAAAMRALLPVGAKVRLWGPGQMLKEDTYGRKLALVLLGETGEDSVQERQIRDGWSPVWEKYGKVPEPWRDRLVAAQQAAREAKAGAWATAEKWMQDKGNETTAPKR